jgi:hypothetical protein
LCAALLALACQREAPQPAAHAAPAAQPLAPAPAPSAAAPHPLLPPGQWQLAVAAGVVSVDASEAPRRPLLEALAKRAGFALEAAAGDWPPLTLRVDAIPLESALPLLVGELEYRAEWVSGASGEGVHKLAKLVVGGPRSADASDGSSLAPGVVSDSLQHALRVLHDEKEPMAEADALALLKDADPEQRVRAVLELEGEGDGLKALVGAIERDPDPRVRAAATVGLEDSEEFAAVQALVGALRDPNADVVLEAIDSLEYAGDASVVASLQPLLAHTDPRVRKAASDAIRLLGD